MRAGLWVSKCPIAFWHLVHADWAFLWKVNFCRKEAQERVSRKNLKERTRKTKEPDVHHYPEKVESREERSATPPLASPILTGLERSWPFFCPPPSSLSILPKLFNPQPYPPALKNNPQSPNFLPLPTQFMCSQWQISRLYGCAPALHPSPLHSSFSLFFYLMLALLPLSEISVYTAFMSFLLPVRSTLYTPWHVHTNMHL